MMSENAFGPEPSRAVTEARGDGTIECSSICVAQDWPSCPTERKSGPNSIQIRVDNSQLRWQLIQSPLRPIRRRRLRMRFTHPNNNRPRLIIPVGLGHGPLRWMEGRHDVHVNPVAPDAERQNGEEGSQAAEDDSGLCSWGWGHGSFSARAEPPGGQTGQPHSLFCYLFDDRLLSSFHGA